MKLILDYFKSHKVEAIILIMALILLIWVGITLTINTGWSFIFDSNSIDHFGSFMGGLATFIGIYYLYMTLRSQNESFQIQNFESKFIELIKFNRDLVSSMKATYTYSIDMQQISGKEIFDFFNQQMENAIEIVSTFINSRELSSLYNNSEQYNTDKDLWNETQLKKRTIMNISYLITFFGVKANGCSLLKNKYLTQYKAEEIEELLKLFRMKLAMNENSTDSAETNPLNISRILTSENKLFAGFQNELGNYFRTFFQCVNFANKQKFIKYSDKYDYVKMLRGQLSNMEEVVLFYNSLSDIGIAWEYYYYKNQDFNNMLIKKYNLIKNIPENFTKFSASLFYPMVFFEHMTTEPANRAIIERKYT